MRLSTRLRPDRRRRRSLSPGTSALGHAPILTCRPVSRGPGLSLRGVGIRAARTSFERRSEETAMIDLPRIVSPAEWQAAHDALLVKEKAATRARDALAADRRRLPMVRIDKPCEFDGPRVKARLLDVFEGRRQLILYLHVRTRRERWPDAAATAARWSSTTSDISPTCTHADVDCARLDRAAAQDRGLPQAHGMVDSVVFVSRQRLQPTSAARRPTARCSG